MPSASPAAFSDPPLSPLRFGLPHSCIEHVEHLRSTLFAYDDLDLGERQLLWASTFDYDLDNFAAAVGFARQAVKSLVEEQGGIIDDSLEEAIYKPAQRILHQVHRVKMMAGQLVGYALDFQQRDCGLKPDLHAPLRVLVSSVSQATDVAIRLAQKTGEYLTDIKQNQTPLDVQKILGFLADVTADVGAQDVHPWDIIGMFVTRLGNDIGAYLPQVKAAIQEDQLLHCESPPSHFRVP